MIQLINSSFLCILVCCPLLLLRCVFIVFLRCSRRSLRLRLHAAKRCIFPRVAVILSEPRTAKTKTAFFRTRSDGIFCAPLAIDVCEAFASGRFLAAHIRVSLHSYSCERMRKHCLHFLFALVRLRFFLSHFCVCERSVSHNFHCNMYTMHGFFNN